MNKILLFIIVFICISCFANAQITKGSLLVGGTLQHATEKVEEVRSPDETRNRYLTISPAVGFAVKENLIFGIDLRYGVSKREINSVENYNYKNYGAGVFLTRYIPLARNFYFFAEGRAGVSSLKEVQVYQMPYPTRKVLSVNIALHPGVSYVINRKFQVEAGLSNFAFIEYNSSKFYSSTNETHSKSFNIGTNLSNSNPLSLGFHFLFIK